MARGWRELKEENVLGICESMLRNHAPAEVRTVRNSSLLPFRMERVLQSPGKLCDLACMSEPLSGEAKNEDPAGLRGD
jgi:hypothetical protein